MRGISFSVRTSVLSPRFNPAYAGNMLSDPNPSRTGQVQPRVCGEYVVRSQSITDRTGSTPRMRGILMHSHLMHIDQRFNPAYAGNMFCPVNPLLLFRVQPRVCGEYFAQSLIYFNWSGSTPRMRGISI